MRISDWSSDVCSSDLGLSATIADPAQYAAWLAPDSRGETVTIVEGEAGADPDIEILLPEGAVPWAGHSGRWARSEEHTSELQSLMRISYAVFCLKKKKTKKSAEDYSRKKQYLDSHVTLGRTYH